MRRPRFEWDKQETRADTVSRQWEELQGYEAQLESTSSVRQPQDRASSVKQPQDRVGAKTNKEKIKQMKSSANQKMSSFKSHITGFYRHGQEI